MALTSSRGAPGSAARPAYPGNDVIASAGGDAVAPPDRWAGRDGLPDGSASEMAMPAAARTIAASAACAT